MRKQRLFSILTMVWLLVIGLLARGQTPTGAISVCKGSTATYTVPVDSQYQYHWSAAPLGNVTGSANGSATVAWGAAGAGSVTVTVTNSSNTVVSTGTLAVTVNPLPTPFITTTTRLACQPLNVDTTDKQRNPQFNDTSACMKVCAHSSVVYTANGNPGSTYTWSASGAASISPSGNTCTVTWGNPGQGTVTVTETTAAGCVGSRTMCIDIQETPNARCYAMPDSTLTSITVCLNGSVVFVDRSTASSGSPIVTWFWDFGDGTQITTGPGASGNPVTHQYTHPGTYTVSLTVTNACGCSSTFKKIRVTVKTVTGVTISCPRVVCEGETAHYTVDFPCKTTSWKALGGTIVTATPAQADVVWNTPPASGFGYIVYDNTACGTPCGGITTVKVPIIMAHGVIDGQAVVCPNKQYVYRLPEWPSTKFNWTITSGAATLSPTDQRNEIVVNTGNAGGTYTLNCDYTNTMLGCSGSASFTITVQPPVTVGGPKLVCLNATANYTITGTGAANWTLTKPNGSTVPYSGTSINPLFDQVGTYQLYAYGAFCSPDPMTIKVNPLPTTPDSLLGPGVACAGVPTMYTAKNPQAGSIFQWSVSAGTVNGLTGNTTYASFAGAAPYTISVVRVTQDDAHCMSAPLSMTVQAPVTSIHIIGPDTVCANTFKNYTVSYTNGDTYDWAILSTTMGSISSGNNTPNVSALWNNVAGPAKLVVTMRKCFNILTDTLNVFVKGVPTITLTRDKDTVCSGDIVTFTAGASPAVSSFGSVLWNFGDGNTSTTGFPVKAYAYNTTGSNTVASFTATVTVTDPNGCSVTINDAATPVWVKPVPVAHISPDGPIYHCSTPFSDALTATVTTGFGSTTAYQWSNLGSTGPINNVTNFGSYYVIVFNSNGCHGQSNTVNVVQSCPTPCGPGTPPTITLTPSITACGHVHINASTTGGFNPQWSLPPGAQNVVNTATSSDADYTVAGNYVYVYTVNYVNTAGDTCIVAAQTNQIVPYIAGLMHSVTCLGGSYQVTLLDHSNIYPGTSILHNYYLDGSPITGGTGTSATSITVTAAPGFHTLRQDIYSGSYPICTVTDTLTLDPLPVASFSIVNTPSPACLIWVPVQFNNTSTPGSGVTCLWDFNDGATNTQMNPFRVYNLLTPATKNVVLTVSNRFGCTSSVSHPVTTVASNLGQNTKLDNSPASACLGDPMMLTYNGLGNPNPTNYEWHMGNTTLFSTTIPTAYVYNPGGYWVYGTNAAGCVVKTVLDTVNFIQAPPAVISGNQEQCVGSSFVLSAYAGNIPGITYQWYLNSAPISGATQATLNQTQFGATTYNYTVVVSVPKPGGGTCSNTSAIFTVTVHALPPTPSVSFSIPNCQPYTVNLSATTGVTGTYNWNNGLLGANVTTYAGGPYQVTFTDQYGCISRNSIAVPKDPNVYLWIFPTGCFCRIQGKDPYITGPLPVFSKWAYLFNGGILATGTNTTVPDLHGLNAGVYNLYLDNGFCNVTSDNMYYNDGPCKTGPYRMAGAEETSVLSNTGTDMNLVPNPAQTQVRIDYLLSGEGTDHHIEVYDMMGKLLVSHAVTDVSGSWTMPVTDFASGMYLVVMRRGGDVLQMRKLSVTH